MRRPKGSADIPIFGVFTSYIVFSSFFPFRCDSIEKLRRRCETLDGEIKEPSKFKEFYQFTFNFAKNPGQKSLGESEN